MGTLKVNNIQSTTDGSVTFPQGSISSQPVILPSGTASNPSLSFTNDSDTGLYRIDANKIGISSNGSRVGEIGNGYGGFTGNIIQVQSTTKSDTFSSSGSANFEDITGLNVSITPRYSNSRILINSLIVFGGNFWDNVGRVNLVRNGVNIMQPSGGTTPSSVFARAYGTDSSNSGNMGIPICLTFLDSPNTTSIITYKIQGLVSTATWYINRIANNANATGVSTITVMEIQQ